MNRRIKRRIGIAAVILIALLLLIRFTGVSFGKIQLVAAFTRGFRTPIEINGKVVDQHGDPVAGATVKMSAVDTPYADGDSEPDLILTSDADGKFSAKGLRGVSMGVSVIKAGYLHLPPLGGPSSSAMVDYGIGSKSGGRYRNSATPLVLTLHKIGPMEPMMYVECKNRMLPLDGTVRSIALDSEKGEGPHQIDFRFKSGRNKLPERSSLSTPFDWSFEARISGGGFIWNDGEYNFEAPETGYKETIRIEYKADMPKEKWMNYVNGRFFVKFADGSYGRIRFSIDGIEDRVPLNLGSWLCLKPGSRNLATSMTDDSGFNNNEESKKEWGY